MKYKLKYEVYKNEYSEVVYGDSVTADTPVLVRCKTSGVVSYIKISELSNDIWLDYHMFKPFDKGRKEKQYSFCNYESWSNEGWSNILKVIKHKTSKKIYRVSTNIGIVDVTEDHSLIKYNGEYIKPNEANIGTPLLHSFPWYEPNEFNINAKVASGDLDKLSKLYLGYRKQGYSVLLEENEDKYIKMNISKFQKKTGDDILIKKIRYMGNTEQFVYDLETTAGKFQAGLGEIIVKNTDSCMIQLQTPALIKFKELLDDYSEIIKLTEDEQRKVDEHKTKAIEEAFEQGKALADEITEKLFKKPIELEFEKVYYPFILLSKKRYIGNYYGSSPYKIDYTEKKGVVLKRRDNPEIVKKVYNGVIDPILHHGSRGVNISIDFLKSKLDELMHNKIDLNDLVVTKTLAKGYGKLVNGELIMKDTDYKNFNIPHVALAAKLRDRDPGSAPVVNDRISYVFVELPDKPAAKLYEKVEDLQTAIDNNMRIDVLYYVENQLKNPISEVLNLIIKDVDSFFSEATKEYKDKRADDVKRYKIKAKIPKGQISILKWLKPDN